MMSKEVVLKGVSVRRFLILGGGLVFTGIASLLNEHFFWGWPVAIVALMGLGINFFAKKCDIETRKFLNVLVLVFLVGAVILGVIGFLAVYAATYFSA